MHSHPTCIRFCQVQAGASAIFQIRKFICAGAPDPVGWTPLGKNMSLVVEAKWLTDCCYLQLSFGGAKCLIDYCSLQLSFGG